MKEEGEGQRRRKEMMGKKTDGECWRRKKRTEKNEEGEGLRKEKKTDGEDERSRTE
jgi:hypothetical protein